MHEVGGGLYRFQVLTTFGCSIYWVDIHIGIQTVHIKFMCTIPYKIS